MITGTSPKQIYFNATLKHEVSVIVPQSLGVEEDGKKLVKAGTPININLENRSTEVKKVDTDNVANAIVVHDVDVTADKASVAACIFGFINLDRIDTTTQALITATVKTSLAGKVYFLKDN